MRRCSREVRVAPYSLPRPQRGGGRVKEGESDGGEREGASERGAGRCSTAHPYGLRQRARGECAQAALKRHVGGADAQLELLLAVLLCCAAGGRERARGEAHGRSGDGILGPISAPLAPGGTLRATGAPIGGARAPTHRVRTRPRPLARCQAARGCPRSQNKIVAPVGTSARTEAGQGLPAPHNWPRAAPYGGAEEHLRQHKPKLAAVCIGLHVAAHDAALWRREI